LTAGAFSASDVTVLGMAGDATWFAGTGADGRPFVAAATDAGEPGLGVDTVRLWVGGSSKQPLVDLDVAARDNAARAAAPAAAR
jgi:hypothetical protein